MPADSGFPSDPTDNRHPTKALNALGWTLRGRNLPAGDSIGQQVAILRKRQKLSQRSLAAMAGITQPTVIALEVRNSGRLSSLNAILTVLGAGPVLSAAGENPSFYAHAGNSSAHEAWSTPSWILDRLYSVFEHFARSENHHPRTRLARPE